MLSLQDVTLRRGTKVLFEGARLTVHRGQKVGLTGANGTGKSSLFELVRGTLHADSGDLSLPPGTVIAHVAQETPAVAASVLDYVLDGDTALRETERAITAAEAANDGRRLAELHARFEALDGYTARARAGRLLAGLGFAPEDAVRPVHSFSGGWRVRLNLAQALMCPSDLLLLDEPTNHLDLDAVLWLEAWLRAYRGTLLLISHDRDFLDAVVTHVLHIERQRVTLYTGNYSAFEHLRAEALANQQAAFVKQQEAVARMQRFVDRFRAQATKARQAQSRLKALERMELIAPAHVDSPFGFSFRPPERLPAPLLTLEGAAAGYGDRTVLDKVGLALRPGDRIGLLGRNGAGKSTLVKLLAGELTPSGGKRTPAPDLNLGYFAQHQLEQLRPGDSPLLHLARLDPKAPEQALRDFLGGFGFSGDQALAPVGPFSGGEKARLVLALLVYRRPNLLLLDEPTNHLDLEMRHALTMALQGYEGALVVVSHDRHLLRTVTDRLLLVADGAVTPFDGDLEDYRRWLEGSGRDAAVEATGEPTAHSAVARKDRRREEAERRQRLKPLRDALQKAETKLDKLNAARARLDEKLAEPDLYDPAAKEQLRKLLAKKAELERDLRATEEAWLEAGAAIEAAEPEETR